jgi:hypothetical protein
VVEDFVDRARRFHRGDGVPSTSPRLADDGPAAGTPESRRQIDDAPFLLRDAERYFGEEVTCRRLD